jgi:sRNA-binding carbon storage regulator CsrA
MLTFERRIGESFMVGLALIKIGAVSSGGVCKIHVDAPRTVPINRGPLGDLRPDGGSGFDDSRLTRPPK